MTIYSAYAPIYDAIGQGAFAEQLVARILAALPAPPRRALELACGTGAAALALAAAGAEVVGVDRSPQMLAIAHGCARDLSLPVSFVEADLRDLPIADGRSAESSALGLQPASFQLITCLYDSLNYLTDDGDLARAIAGAAHMLAPGGRFIFDLNSEAEYASWDDSDQVVHDAGGLLVYNRLSYDQVRRRAQGGIVWFSRDGARWWRGEEQHTQRAWADAEVQVALEAAGLTLLARRTPHWALAGPDAPRVVYESARA
jgi:SAM-dependent methyltransferase